MLEYSTETLLVIIKHKNQVLEQYKLTNERYTVKQSKELCW